MAVVDYSQTGISARAIEEARRRRGQRSAYAPSMSGLSELDTERDVQAAATSDGDVQAAADPRRVSAMLRAPMSDLSLAQRPEGQGPYALREPMTGAPEAMRPAIGIDLAPEPPEPATTPEAPAMKPAGPSAYVDPLDAQDRAQSERIRRQRLGLMFAGIAGEVFGDPATRERRMGAVTGALQSMDPNAPLANIEARAATRREQADAERRMAIEDEQRALEADYRRTLMRSMDVNSDRREFEMQRRGTGDERLYDPSHPLAQSRREFLRRVIATAPGGVGAAFAGMDLDSMGARDLQGLADQVLRRIGQVPNRERSVDDDTLAAIVQGLDDQTTEAAPAVPAEPETPRARAERIARASRAPQGPAPRRDRTIAEINADRMAERRGLPPPSGYRADDLTPGELQTIARGVERRGNPSLAARLAGGIDTQSREAQFQQTGQSGAFNEADITRAARIMTPIMRQSRQLRGLIARVDQIDDATFRQAMQGGNLASLGFNAADFQAQWAAYSNPELRERSGAAVTDNEYQRFVQEFNAGRLNSREQFKRALQRVLAEVQANSRSFGLRPDVVQEVYRRGQRGQ